MMKGIDIQFIDHLEQRYNTIGDWWIVHKEEGSMMHIRVSNLPHFASMVAVAVHEIVEASLCRLAGIDPEEVDRFDAQMEREHPDEEPGDSPDAPYHVQHGLATACERIIVAAAGVNWRDHEDAMEVLMHEYRYEKRG